MKRTIFITVVFLVIVMGASHFLTKNTNKQKQDELVFWTLQLGTFSDYINPVIEEFESTHPDIKVSWVDIPYSEGGKRTLAAILSDNPPDLINATPDFSTLLAQKNTLFTFDKTQTEQYLSSIMENLTLNNGQNYYAIPFYATTAVTFYNKNLTKKIGFKKLPKNYSHMYEYSQVTLDKTGSYITMPTINENDTFLKILNKYNLLSPQKINSKEAVNLVEQYKNLYKNGLIPKESLTQTHREALEKFMSGQIVFYNGGGNFLNLIKENAPDTYEVTGVSPQLTGTNGKYDFSLMNLIIPKNAKHKELALEFAKLLTNDKNQLEFAKLTTVLPINKYTLDNEYFTEHNDSDLQSITRTISANQLKNVLPPIIINDKKGLAEIVNKIVAEILLDKTQTQVGLDKIQKWMLKNS